MPKKPCSPDERRAYAILRFREFHTRQEIAWADLILQAAKRAAWDKARSPCPPEDDEGRIHIW